MFFFRFLILLNLVFVEVPALAGLPNSNSGMQADGKTTPGATQGKREDSLKNEFQNKSPLDFATSDSTQNISENNSSTEIYEKFATLEKLNLKKLYPVKNPLRGLTTFEAISSFIEMHLWKESGFFDFLPFQERERSFFGVLYEKVMNPDRNKEEFDEQWLSLKLEEVQAILESPDSKTREYTEIFLSLDLLKDHYIKISSSPEIDRDGNPIEETTKEEASKKNQKEKKDKKTEDAVEEYVELPKKYQPHSKNTEKSEDQPQIRKKAFITANFISKYFVQTFFNTVRIDEGNRVTDFLDTDIYRTEDKMPEGQSDKFIKVKTLGQKIVTLFLPLGYTPLAPKDASSYIIRKKSGAFLLYSDKAELIIPVIEEAEVLLDPIMLNRISEKTGLNIKKIPENIRTFLKSLEGLPPLEIAQKLEKYIQTNFLYKVNASDEKTPLEALYAGKFQCDFAAAIMVSILRDYFNISSIAVGGVFGIKTKDKNLSHVANPVEGHSWVRVLIHQKWYNFDPTPIKKDKASESQEQDPDSEFENILDDENNDEESPEDSSEEFDKKNEPQKEKSSSDKKDLKKEILEASEATKNKVKEEYKNFDESLNIDSNDEETVLDINALIDKLEIGSIHLEKNTKTNPLDARIKRILLKKLSDPRQNLKSTISRFSIYKEFLQHSKLAEKYKKIIDARTKVKDNLLDELSLITHAIFKSDLNKTYFRIYYLRNYILEYLSLLDPTEKTPGLIELTQTLHNLLLLLQSISDQSAQNIALVKEFISPFPSALLNYLNKKYGFVEAGKNQPTKKIAEDLISGKLNDLILIRNLLSYADFIQDSTPRPEYINAKNYLRNTNKPVGKDLLTVQNIAEAMRGMQINPGEDFIESFLNGNTFTQLTRKEVQIAKGYGKDDLERYTILLFDTSGSMAGNPEVFQAALISAFNSIALSDISPSGRLRHKILLLGFDQKVHFKKELSTLSDFQDFIDNHKKYLKNTASGTDIMAALTQAFASIADAQQRSGDRLGLANIILMTDGQADVKLPELLTMRNAIDRRTPIQLLNVAIQTSNPDLVKFAQESSQAGFEKGYYFEFGNSHIDQIIEESKTFTLKDKLEGFFTEKTAEEGLDPYEVQKIIYSLKRLSNQVHADISNFSRSLTPEYWKEQVSLYSHSRIEETESPLQGWINSARSFSYSTSHKLGPKRNSEREIMHFILNDILKNFESLTGQELSDLKAYEIGEIRHWIQEIHELYQ